MKRLAPIAFIEPFTVQLENLLEAHFSCFSSDEQLKIVHFGGYFEGIRSCCETKNNYLKG